MKSFLIYFLLFLFFLSAIFFAGNFLMGKLSQDNKQSNESAPLIGSAKDSLQINAQTMQTNTANNENELVLFYNKDFVGQAPHTWGELKNKIIELKQEYCPSQCRDLSFFALGRADNVAYSSQIFALLTLQQGLNWPEFNNDLGERALKFYNEFGNKQKKVYNWDKDQANSLQTFADGSLAMVVARMQDKEKFSQINYGLAQVPVIANSNIVNIDYPQISTSADAILCEMIESVADNRASFEQAINKAYKEIKEL